MTKNTYNFIDFFAGAGGFSEGFLQAETESSQFDFLLGSDINENCEVTHIMRYKYQLGMEHNKFLCKDITDEDFVHQLKEMLENNEIDVICGGPPCQSFSLAGRRRTFDKKDDLFRNYLNIVREIKPKYFVMENVKGILTKYDGEVVTRIKREISEILDENEVVRLQEALSDFSTESKVLNVEDKKRVKAISLLLSILAKGHDERTPFIQKYFAGLYNDFTSNLSKFCNYHTSKTDSQIATVRHGLKMLEHASVWNKISFNVMRAKGLADVDNDNFVNKIDTFLKAIEPDSIIYEIEEALNNIKHKGHFDNLIYQIKLYQFSVEEYLDILKDITTKDSTNKNFPVVSSIIESGINLYNLNDPMVLLASDYGVPQNRERVIFLGCRKDQNLITEITKTTPRREDKTTIFEALHDLDNIDINETVFEYYEPSSEARIFNKEYNFLNRKRFLGGELNKKGKTFAEWSFEGRLNPERFNVKPPAFCTNYNEYTNQFELDHLEFSEKDLHNHQTSKHSPDVQKRLSIIRKFGDYKKAASELHKNGVSSKKRNYTPFLPDVQSTTIMTIADDYVHYRADRAPTVREMARLQSFDDSFVFQGKRTTGGHRRKDEIPQFTLVGNAVPPLMARAIADEILRNIN